MPLSASGPNLTDWFELRCRVSAGVYAQLEFELENLGAASITLAEGDTTLCDEPGVDAGADWSSFEVRALFEAGTDPAQLIACVREKVPAITSIETVTIKEQAWHEVWRDTWQPQMFAGGICVCPRWRRPPAAARHVIYIDPGRAFGTGTHETTALCLEWLARGCDVSGCTVVDYGCGSGILALAAARLHAAQTYAVDIDEEALAVVRDNAAFNGLKIDIGQPRLITGKRVDVILANILLEPLLALEPSFAAHLHKDGRIVLSGLLETQSASVLEVYGARFTMEAPVVRGEWALLVGRRR